MTPIPPPLKRISENPSNLVGVLVAGRKEWDEPQEFAKSLEEESRLALHQLLHNLLLLLSNQLPFSHLSTDMRTMFYKPMVGGTLRVLFDRTFTCWCLKNPSLLTAVLMMLARTSLPSLSSSSSSSSSLSISSSEFLLSLSSSCPSDASRLSSSMRGLLDLSIFSPPFSSVSPHRTSFIILAPVQFPSRVDILQWKTRLGWDVMGLTGGYGRNIISLKSKELAAPSFLTVLTIKTTSLNFLK